MVGSLADAGVVIDKYSNAIAEPARRPRCPALIRELAQASHRVRHVVIDTAGRRGRMPIGVIAASYFLRAGTVLPTVMLVLVYRQAPSARRAGDEQ